ncbi:MAG: VCBS repeat-containing protein [Chloroflexi bacterium]|nr:VCBS repeat-containing protein [Chloroflexota bacterium]
MDTDDTGISDMDRSEEQTPSVSRRLLAWRRATLFSLGAIAALGVGAGLVFLYVVDTAPDDTPEPVARVFDTAGGDTKDLAGYCRTISASSDPYFGTKQRKQLLRLMETPLFASHSGYVNLRIPLAFDYLRFGEADEAIRLLTEALESEERDDPDGKHLREILEGLAVTSLKQGELSNRINPSARLVCTLPLGNAQGYENRNGSTNAIEYFVRLLELYPDDLKYRWLLNVAHMTLGTYPAGVPVQFLIPRELLATDYDIGQFEEVATEVGLSALNLAGGSIIDDFDNDGWLDIVTSTWDPGGPIIYYHNDGDGTFSDYTARAGLSDQLGGLNIVQTDYNNDGWLDILVMRGGWLRSRGGMRVSLLRNNGDGTFADVTREAKLAHPAYPSQTAGWADYDNDGDLDLFSCSESQPESDIIEDVFKFPSQLFENNGDGTFTDVARAAGVKNERYCKGSVWGDYDNDGYPDLYVSNFEADNRLYHNNGDGTFTDVASELGVTEPVPSFATWFWDYNNDGWLDLFVAGYGYRIEDVAADYLGLPNDGARMRLYKNDGAGGFIDVTRETGLYRVHLVMAANFGDLDNDGFLDFYLGTGYPRYDALAPNIAYRNNDGLSFTDVTFSAGLGHLHKGHGIAFGDLDRDGDQDIFAQIGGFYPGDGFENALYRNPGHGNRWLSAKLIGVESNRAAIGARIKVELAMRDGSRRAVYSWVNSGGSFGASSLEQEMGLGQAERILSLEVFWPTSGIRQAFDDVPLDTRIEITEGDDDYEVLETRPIRLGGGG